MESVLYFLLLFICAASVSPSSVSKRVTVREVSATNLERSPDVLELELELESGEQQKLVLKRNVHYNKNVAVESLENGIKKRQITDPRDVTEYTSGIAAIHATSEQEGDGFKRRVRGVLYMPDAAYLVEPESDDREKRNTHIMTPLDTPPLNPKHINKVGQYMNDIVIAPRLNRTNKYRSGRKFRGSKNSIVDVLVVIDNALYKKMSDKFNFIQDPRQREDRTVNYIKMYYGILWAGVVQRYASVNYKGMTITPRLGQILILKSKQDDDDIFKGTKDADTVEGNGALLNIVDWFQTENRYGQYDDIDHIMVFTGERLWTWLDSTKQLQDFRVVGLAYLGTVCQYWQSSIIEDDLTYKAIGTAAHELGHNLGASHDGHPSSCASDDHYIMVPYVTYGEDNTYQNQFQFSSCSLEQMYQVMEQLNNDDNNCMAEQPKQRDEEARLGGVVPGLMFDLHIQCQIFTGDDQSYYCGPNTAQHLMYNGCRKFDCYQRDNGRESCKSIGTRVALHGTPCGKDMWCESGRCVRAPRGLIPEEYYGVCPVRDSPECSRSVDCRNDHEAKKCCNRCIKDDSRRIFTL